MVIESGQVPKKGSNLGKYQKNLGEYRKIVEFGRVPEEGRIWESTKKGRIQVSIEKGSNLGEYRKRVKSGQVPKKGRIRESAG